MRTARLPREIPWLGLLSEASVDACLVRRGTVPHFIPISGLRTLLSTPGDLLVSTPAAVYRTEPFASGGTHRRHPFYSCSGYADCTAARRRYNYAPPVNTQHPLFLYLSSPYRFKASFFFMVFSLCHQLPEKVCTGSRMLLHAGTALCINITSGPNTSGASGPLFPLVVNVFEVVLVTRISPATPRREGCWENGGAQNSTP